MNSKDNWITIQTLSKYILLILIGFSISQLFFNKNTNDTNNKNIQEKDNKESSKEIRLNEGYNYINPLLECTDNIGGIYIPDSLKDELNSYIAEQQNKKIITDVSVYFRDLNNGPWFGINEKELFTPASLTKVPMMMLYFKKAETDTEILNQKLKTTKDSISLYNNQVIVPDNKLIEDKEYTIQELIEHMIYYSDNVAYTLLKSNLKEYELNKLFLDFGIDISARLQGPNEDLLSVREYASFFRILYNSSYLNRDHSEKALNILSNTKYDKGLVKGVNNRDIKISHKFGERELLNQTQLHDCGIIYKGNNPYLLCVMTRGNNLDNLANIISDISSMIYKYRD